ncbi:MAG: ankyrin repeat domain-containing protein [Mailhella sp.]|nr:ankyrin repeat domain-containing protein [Mailhella sp.]
MSDIFAGLSRNALRCCLASAVLFCAVPCDRAPAAIYEVDATGKDAAAAEGNARLNALRQSLGVLLSPEAVKKHAMDLRPVLRKAGSLTGIEVLKTGKKGALTALTARVTVDDEALRAELGAIPALGAGVARSAAADPGGKPAAAENSPQQPPAASAGGSSREQGPSVAGSPAGNGGKPAGQAPQKAAMPDADFLRLVADMKTPPEDIIAALAAGADPNAAVTADNRVPYANPGWPALMVYLYEKSGPRNKSAAVVKAFLDAGADADWHSTKGLQRRLIQTAMYLSFRSEEGEQIFRLILSARPDLNRVYDSGKGLLHDYLDFNGKPEIVAHMLACGADPNAVVQDKRPSRQTPVLFVSIQGLAGKKLPTVYLQTMLKAGGDPNITDGTGQSVLHYALACGAWEHAMLLLEAGADPDKTNDKGETALLHAVKDGAPAGLIEAMLAHKADPDRADKTGCPPLGFAIREDRTDIVRLLLQKGARLDIAIPYENETFSPVELAEKLGREEMASCMRELAGKGAGASSPGKRQEAGAQKAGAMPDAEFLRLAADRKTTPAAIINALAAGADPNALVTNEMHIPAPLNIISWPPLMLYLHPHTGPEKKSARVAEAFVKAGADVNWMNEGGNRESIVKTAMQLSFKGDAEGEAIFRCIVSARPDMNRVDKYGYTLIHDWLDTLNHNQKTDILEYMLAHGADPNAVRQSDNPRRRQPVLFDAIKGTTGGPLPTGNLAAMLRSGADPDICDGTGKSALHYALEGKAFDAFDLLLRSGADPDKVNDKGETPLFCAVDDHADMAFIKALLEHKANVNIAAAKRNNNTPLIEAARSWDEGGETLVDMLLAAGADPNARVANGRTALIFAVRDKKTAVARKLLDKGADPNIAEKDGISPLVYAVRSGDPDMVRLLVKHGADTKAKIKYKDGRMVSLRELVELQSDAWKISDEMKACVAALPD